MEKDIKRAIKIEQVYLEDKKNDIYYSLEEQLQQIGFLSLAEYFELKKQYLLSEIQLDLIYCGVEEITSTIKQIFNNKRPSLLIVKSDRIFLYHGDESYDKNFCEKNDILVHEIGHHGGTIVVGKKDISVGLFLPSSIKLNFQEDFLRVFYQILSKYYLNVKIDNNDILINNRKILGATVMKNDNFSGYVTNISFENNLKLIKTICGGNMTDKIPGYLKKINREQLEQEVLKCLL